MRYLIEDERRTVLKKTDSPNALAGLVTRIRNNGMTDALVIRDTQTDETFEVPAHYGITSQGTRPSKPREPKRDPKRGPKDLEDLFHL